MAVKQRSMNLRDNVRVTPGCERRIGRATYDFERKKSMKRYNKSPFRDHEKFGRR
jgi:hypothetical protein